MGMRRRRDTTVVMLLAVLGVVTLTPATSLATAAGEAARAASHPSETGPPPVRTGKERLSGKAADEQRVDNCKVPLALRGSKPRPDDCAKPRGDAPTQ